MCLPMPPSWPEASLPTFKPHPQVGVGPALSASLSLIPVWMWLPMYILSHKTSVQLEFGSS